MTTPAQSAALTPRQQRFVDEYLIDLNATQAAIRAGYSAKTAFVQGCRLLKYAKVQAAIQRGKARIAEVAEVKAADVLRLIWDTANADPRHLIEYRRGCCRFCHGKDFLYQRTLNEERSAVAQHQRNLERWDGLSKKEQGNEKAPVFDALGGIGFNATKQPNPECPECFGEGVERAYVHDTRKLSRASLALYAGVRVTKEGVEVKMHDQQAARIQVGKHLGLFKEFEDPPESEEDRIKRLRAGLKAMDDATLGAAA